MPPSSSVKKQTKKKKKKESEESFCLRKPTEITPESINENNKDDEDYSPLSRLVLSHFDTYQRQQDGHHSLSLSMRQRRRQRGGSSTSQEGIMDDKAVTESLEFQQARRSAKKLWKDISEWQVSQAVSRLSLTGSAAAKDDDNKDEIGQMMLHCVDSAFVVLVGDAATSPVADAGKAKRTGRGGTPTFSSTKIADGNGLSPCVERTFHLAAAAVAEASSGASDKQRQQKQQHQVEWQEQLLERASKLAATATLERVRTGACLLLGLCVAHWWNRPQQQAQPRQEHLQKQEQLLSMTKAALIYRLADKSQMVRQEALQSSSYIFENNLSETDDDEDEDENDIQNKHDDLLEAMLVCLTSDTSHTNRCTAVRNIPVAAKTIPYILERVRDLKMNVRVEALETLQRKVNVMDLTPEQRSDLLLVGLGNRCAMTNAAASRLLCSGWMMTLKFDPVLLLRLLDPAINDQGAKKAADTILSAATSSRDNDVGSIALRELSDPEVVEFREKVKTQVEALSLNDTRDGTLLDPAQILLLRTKCEQTLESKSISAATKEDILSTLIPDITALCDALKLHLDRITHATEDNGKDDGETNAVFQENETFVCQQLLHLAKYADPDEEGSKRHFLRTLQEVLTSSECPQDLIESIVMALSIVHTNEGEFLEAVAEVVDIAEGTEDSEGDNASSLHAISILSVALENVSGRMSTHPVFDKLQNFVLMAVTSGDDLVREAGVSCIGKVSLLMEEASVWTEIKPLLLKIAGNSDERLEIRAQACMALGDLTMFFNDMLREDTSENTNLTMLSLLEDLLSSNEMALAIVGAEVSIKLLYAGRIRDSNIVAHLLKLFFHQELGNAAAAEGAVGGGSDVVGVGSPVRLQQLLSLFFPAFCLQHATSREMVARSTRPLLELLLLRSKPSQGGRGNRSFTVPLAKIVEYVWSVVDMGDSQAIESYKKEKKGRGEEEQNGRRMETFTIVVYTAVAEILASDELTTTVVRTLCKILGAVGIDVDSDDPAQVRQFKQAVEEAEMTVQDERARKDLLRLMEEELEDIPSEAEEDSLIQGMNNVTLDEDAISQHHSLQNDDECSTETEATNKENCVTPAKKMMIMTPPSSLRRSARRRLVNRN